jgi:hypothetical protein
MPRYEQTQGMPPSHLVATIHCFLRSTLNCSEQPHIRVDLRCVVCIHAHVLWRPAGRRHAESHLNHICHHVLPGLCCARRMQTLRLWSSHLLPCTAAVSWPCAARCTACWAAYAGAAATGHVWCLHPYHPQVRPLCIRRGITMCTSMKQGSCPGPIAAACWAVTAEVVASGPLRPVPPKMSAYSKFLACSMWLATQAVCLDVFRCKSQALLIPCSPLFRDIT